MSESIIIDGCNVAECDCYDNTYCLWSKKYHEIRITPKCEIVKDCYFKQLQRAKADIEELKEYNDSYDEAVRALLSEKDKLKAENGKLKKALEEIRGIANGLKSTHCANCSQVLNNKGKCTADCMKDYKEKILTKINEVLQDVDN